MTNTDKLSQQARNALMSAGTNRQGAVVVATAAERAELERHGLIGPGGGLTRTGTIIRERVVEEAMDF